MKATTQLALQLQAVQRFLGNNDLPIQQILTFLHVAGTDDLPMADLVELTGVAQSSVSRNVARLGRGTSPSEPGYGLMEAYEDPYYRKRELVKLLPRGKELVKAGEKVTR
jgi:DNA-binding MarR family transcriptional regulator